jgi:sirohydrochlorin ferrochelatase
MPTKTKPHGEGYNADERAAAREAEPITIGGQLFHRARKLWHVELTTQEHLERQGRMVAKAARLKAQAAKLEEQAAEDGVEPDDTVLEDLYAQAREAQRASGLATFDVLATLLRDGDGNAPSVEFLQEQLDVSDAVQLGARLAGYDEPDESDPTPATATS